MCVMSDCFLSHPVFCVRFISRVCNLSPVFCVTSKLCLYYFLKNSFSSTSSSQWVSQCIAVPIFRPQWSVSMNLSLSLPLPSPLFVGLISISSLPFILPVQLFDWQVIISYPIFRGKTVIHCRRLVAALWTSSLSPVESCDLPLASCSEKLKEKHAPDSYHSISKLMILSLSFSLSGWRMMVLLRGTVAEFIRVTRG